MGVDRVSTVKGKRAPAKRKKETAISKSGADQVPDGTVAVSPALLKDVSFLKDDAGELAAVLGRQIVTISKCSLDHGEIAFLRDRVEHLALDLGTVAGLLKRFFVLWSMEKALSSVQSAAKAELRRSAEALKPIFGQLGINEIKTSEMTTFLKRSVHGSLIAATKPEAITKLKEEGLEFLVKEEVNQQTFDKWVREQETDERDMPLIPDPIKPFVSVAEIYEVKGRKA